MDVRAAELDYIEATDMGSDQQEIAEWVYNHLCDNGVIDELNNSGKLFIEGDLDSLTDESWEYFGSVIKEGELIRKACEDMKAWPEAAQEEFYRVQKETFQYDQKLASSGKEAEED